MAILASGQIHFVKRLSKHYDTAEQHNFDSKKIQVQIFDRLQTPNRLFLQ